MKVVSKANTKYVGRMVLALVIAAIIIWIIWTLSAKMRSWVESKVPA